MALDPASFDVVFIRLTELLRQEFGSPLLLSSLEVIMAFFSLHSYSAPESSGGQGASTGHRSMDGREVGPIGGSFSNFTLSDSNFEPARSE